MAARFRKTTETVELSDCSEIELVCERDKHGDPICRVAIEDNDGDQAELNLEPRDLIDLAERFKAIADELRRFSEGGAA